MAMDSDPKLAELRRNVDRAIREFVAYRCGMYEPPRDHVYVVGWAAFAEYTDAELTQQDMMGNMAIVPDEQPAALSGGLFGAGAVQFGVR